MKGPLLIEPGPRFRRTGDDRETRKPIIITVRWCPRGSAIPYRKYTLPFNGGDWIFHAYERVVGRLVRRATFPGTSLLCGISQCAPPSTSVQLPPFRRGGGVSTTPRNEVGVCGVTADPRTKTRLLAASIPTRLVFGAPNTAQFRLAWSFFFFFFFVGNPHRRHAKMQSQRTVGGPCGGAQ